MKQIINVSLTDMKEITIDEVVDGFFDYCGFIEGDISDLESYLHDNSIFDVTDDDKVKILDAVKVKCEDYAKSKKKKNLLLLENRDKIIKFFDDIIENYLDIEYYDGWCCTSREMLNEILKNSNK